MNVLKKKWIIPLAALVIVLSIAGAAFAATGSSSTETGGTVATAAPTAGVDRPANADGDGRGWGPQRSDETALTGDVLEKVKAAVLAKIGSDATIDRAETDGDGNAKYEVHATKADGTRVMVYVDESYNVVSVETCTGPNGDGLGGGRMGGRGGDFDEIALTGDVLEKVKAAALAAAGSGSTLIRATTDDDGVAKYEAHVKKADGTCVNVYLDESFKVVKTEAAPEGGMGRGGRGGERGGGRCLGATTTGTPAAGASTTGSI